MTTIFALSSGQCRAGVAVIRLSGAAAGEALRDLAGALPEPRRATLRSLRHPQTREVLDRGLVLWFPAPASFTGEDMAELHIHGGRAVTEGVLSALAALPNLRVAEPGEFARRAFENGKFDLTAAEGLADLIDAETAEQRRQALRQSAGGLRVLYDGWRAAMIEALARIEAELDFSDESDVPDTVATGARSVVAALREDIAAHLADGRRGEILRDGLRVVIAGPPNAGKSSLMNALAQRDVAIVSAHAGTTRDVIEVRLDLAGIPVILIDTAGIREAAGEIEQEGIHRALERAKEAELVLWLNEAEGEAAARPAFFPGDDPGGRIIDVVTKIDLASPLSGEYEGAHRISVRTGQGLGDLIDRLTAEARAFAGTGEGAVITRLRHRQELGRSLDALDRFLVGDFTRLELRADDLREAATALGRVTGCVDVEDVLDRIFGEFCIGK